MYPKILEDGLFNDIEEIIGTEYAQVIVPLLDEKQSDKLKARVKWAAQINSKSKNNNQFALISILLQ